MKKSILIFAISGAFASCAPGHIWVGGNKLLQDFRNQRAADNNLFTNTKSHKYDTACKTSIHDSAMVR